MKQNIPKTDQKPVNSVKRKISELCGDDYFDFIYTAAPLLDVIKDSKFIRAVFLPKTETELEKIKKNQAEKSAGKAIEDNFIDIVANDLPLLLRSLSSPEKREHVFKVIAILDETDAETVKGYDGKTVNAKIKSIINEEDFKELFT